MLDRTIPFYNTILRCDKYAPQTPPLPEGFSIRAYRPGDEKSWARMETAIGDFETESEAESYFASHYLQNPARREDILFAVNAEGAAVGSCIAWTDPKETETVSSLHWLVVDEAYQGQGLGRALACAVTDCFAGRFPVYIHTQPWSWKAILLYLSLGFRLQKTDSFARYENQYAAAMETLCRTLTAEQYALLQKCSDA